METEREKITGEIAISPAIAELTKNIFTLSALAEELKTREHGEVTDTIALLFSAAIQLDASDIHLEPEEEQVKLRLRIDGILHDLIFFSKEAYQLFLSRLKLLSGIKLNV